MKLILNNKIRALVCDMAGTTVNEKGIIYKTLYETIKNFGLHIKEENEINKWHGANKHDVLDHYLQKTFHDKTKQNLLRYKLHTIFENNLINNYSEPGNISLIHEDLPLLFNSLREKDIRIFLNTGYPKNIQKIIIDKLNMNDFVDDYISSDLVYYGRPMPYMINALCTKNHIPYRNTVIKIGDTYNDILEGKKANCLKSVGVLTGADDYDTLNNAGADLIINSIMDIELDN